MPTASSYPLLDHDMLVTVTCDPMSYSFVTLEVEADQRYTQDPRPTARVFWLDQSTRFR